MYVQKEKGWETLYQSKLTLLIGPMCEYFFFFLCVTLQGTNDLVRANGTAWIESV